jgi:N-acetylmuramoyl-L-alanine amidase
LVKLTEIAVYGAANVEGSSIAERDRSEVRVVLAFDGQAVYRRGEVPAEGRAPRSLFLDLDEAAIEPAVPPLLAVAAGGVAQLRVTTPEPGRVRVLFDVSAGTAHRIFTLRDPYRVVMDFRDESLATVRAPGYTIVLDPGHGGAQPGAKAPSGLRESDVALSLARRTRRVLSRRLPKARVVLTRDADTFVTLEGRVAIANALDADLFVSIHLNASASPEDKGGVATYVLDGTDDQAAIRLAAAENGTGTEAVTELQRVLASLYRADQLRRSLTLAERVQRGTLELGRRVFADLGDRGVKRSLFYVLVGARMPAVLVEGSFITRPEEAELLATDQYRQALAEGIAHGIAGYVEDELETAGSAR